MLRKTITYKTAKVQCLSDNYFWTIGFMLISKVVFMEDFLNLQCNFHVLLASVSGPRRKIMIINSWQLFYKYFWIEYCTILLTNCRRNCCVVWLGFFSAILNIIQKENKKNNCFHFLQIFRVSEVLQWIGYHVIYIGLAQNLMKHKLMWHI